MYVYVSVNFDSDKVCIVMTSINSNNMLNNLKVLCNKHKSTSVYTNSTTYEVLSILQTVHVDPLMYIHIYYSSL